MVNLVNFTEHYVFSVRVVTEGHPDKFFDLISDTVLDEHLKQDPLSRAACETYVTMGMIIVGGEITTSALFDIAETVRKLGNQVGYVSPECGFDVNTAAILQTIHAQSPDISMGVTKKGKDIGAGDQGLMFGYACNQTNNLMPLPIELAHELALKLTHVRKKKALPYLGPDGKIQVTIEYRDGKPLRAEHVVIAAPHTQAVVTRDGKFTTEEAKQDIIEKVVIPVIGSLMDENTKVTVNGTGKFLVSGPQSDTGLTGRKQTVDTCGGWAQHAWCRVGACSCGHQRPLATGLQQPSPGRDRLERQSGAATHHALSSYRPEII